MSEPADFPPRFDFVRVRVFAGLRAADFFPRVAFFRAGAFLATFFRATAFFFRLASLLFRGTAFFAAFFRPAAFFFRRACFFRELFFFRTAISGSFHLSAPGRSRDYLEKCARASPSISLTDLSAPPSDSLRASGGKNCSSVRCSAGSLRRPQVSSLVALRTRSRLPAESDHLVANLLRRLDCL